jgi:hypothetical protein
MAALSPKGCQPNTPAPEAGFYFLTYRSRVTPAAYSALP